MNKPSNKMNLIFIVLFFLEVLLRSTGSDTLYNLELLLSAVIVYQEFKSRDRFIYLLFIFLTSLLESINFELVGLRAFIFCFVYILINFLQIPIKSLKENPHIKSLAILVSVIFLLQVSSDIFQGMKVNLNPSSIIINIFIYIFIYKIINKYSPSKYVV